MNSIISILIAYNQLLIFQIHQLLVFIAKNIPLKSPKYDAASPKYNKFTVDKLPVIKKFKNLDYKELLQEYKSIHGKDKKPVKSRGKHPVSPGTVCPQCGAPHNYLYDNAGGRGQLWCKVCGLRFSRNKHDFRCITFVCPYCGHTLDKKKQHRKHFNVHKCVNKKCPSYINSLKRIHLKAFLLKILKNTKRINTSSNFTISTGNLQSRIDSFLLCEL